MNDYCYSIEICYKFEIPIDKYYTKNFFPHENKNSESYDVRLELEKISEKHKGIMIAYDYDYIFNQDDTFKNIPSVNYNYIFAYTDDICEFINNLPKKYEILWFNRKKIGNKKDIECKIYYPNEKPQINKFNPDDFRLYKIILDRIKN
jgi:hypothetical protein